MTHIRFSMGSVFLLALPVVFVLSVFPFNKAFAGVPASYYPNVELINQDGEPMRFYDDVIKGKVVAINFMYTSCGDSCPLETAKLRDLYRMLGDHLGKDVYMYSISVDAEHDTPEVLKAYKKKFKVGPLWTFLTGKQADIDLIRKKLGMFREEEDDLDEHAVNFILGNASTGQWVKRTPFDVPQTLVAVLLGRLQKYPMLTSVAQGSYATARKLANADLGENGQDLFVTRCTTCHTIGQGDGLGPDLAGVTDRRDHAWLVRWLMEPDKMLKEGDPIALELYNKYNQIAMPNMRLTEPDAIALIKLRVYADSCGLILAFLGNGGRKAATIFSLRYSSSR
ncbi:MAG: c-type cytochrome [Gammaproteobacteria bacterium]|nr:c-type cytochrome [Gammaproteobacteria bacterium]